MEQGTQLHISTGANKDVSGRIHRSKVRTPWVTASEGKVEPTERNAGEAGEITLDYSSKLMEQGDMNPPQKTLRPRTIKRGKDLQWQRYMSGTAVPMGYAALLCVNTGSNEKNSGGTIQVEPTERNAVEAAEITLDTTDLPEVVDDLLENSTLEPTNLVDKKGKAIERNECQQDYSSKLLEIINAFPRRCGYDSASRHRDLISIWERVEPVHIVAECLNCIAYCCLFPKGFAIEGDELVQLWMAVGLIEQEPMELFAAAYLSIIQDLGGGFISLTREDNMNGEK